jgi:hypothetical protein
MVAALSVRSGRCSGRPQSPRWEKA